MKKVAVSLRSSPTQITPVGTLAEIDRRVYFEYDSAFLDRGLNLSPFKLPSRPGLIEHADRAFGPLPGLVDDSLPDGWGLLLMDRLCRKQGLDPAALSSLDRLLYLGDRTMGALVYHPPADPDPPGPAPLDLPALSQNAQDVYAGSAAKILPQLIRAGGSPGGARPKVLVGINAAGDLLSGEADLPPGFDHWLVKFAARADARDAGPVEFAYSRMARLAGLNLPEARLFRVSRTQSHFGVRRFDRAPGNRRHHVHTFANLLHRNFRIPSADYADLLTATYALTRSYPDVLRAFRHAAFNVAAYNRDDHAKNFAFVMSDSGDWSLSPAYDLLHSPGPGGEHTTTVAGEGRSPTRDHLLQLARQSDIPKKDALSIFDAINAALTHWPRLADEAGVTKKTAKRVAADLQKL